MSMYVYVCPCMSMYVYVCLCMSVYFSVTAGQRWYFIVYMSLQNEALNDFEFMREKEWDVSLSTVQLC